MDLDTFIIAVFCWIDEALTAATQGKHLRQRGPAPVLYDSEVLTMEIVGAYLGLAQDNVRLVPMHTLAVHFNVQREQAPLHPATLVA